MILDLYALIFTLELAIFCVYDEKTHVLQVIPVHE